MNPIRKITIGVDYKNGMSYSVGQEVYGGHTIAEIVEESEGFVIHILKDNFVKEWKKFNKSMGVSVEYDLNYD